MFLNPIYYVNDTSRWMPVKLMIQFINTLEKHGLRLFHKEINPVTGIGMEYSFIHKDFQPYKDHLDMKQSEK